MSPSSLSPWARLALAAWCLLAPLLLPAQGRPQPRRPASGQIVPGEILVKFRSSPALAPMAATVNGTRVRKHLRETGWTIIRLEPGVTPQTAVAAYRARPEVEFAEPSYAVRLHADPPSIVRLLNDPRAAELWGLDQIRTAEAWAHTQGSTNLVVGIVDTGIDYNHPDLAPNMWRNPGEIPGNGIDDDRNGYIDDVHGIDTVDGDGDPYDDAGHGTHVAGIIGAAANNGIGGAGVCPVIRLLALRMLSADHFAGSTQIAEVYDYAIALKRRGVDLRILNNSWGGDFPSLAIKEAVCRAAEAGILVVCSAGNSGSDNDTTPTFPAGYQCDGVISVAASETDDAPARFSNFGLRTVHVTAPGVGILSPWKGGPFYAVLQGTSMSAPHVSGAAALLLAANPRLTPAEVRSILIRTADPLAAWKELVIAGGRINLAQALAQALAPAALPDLDLKSQISNFKLAGSALPSLQSDIAYRPMTPANPKAPVAARFSLVSSNAAGRGANHASYSPALSSDGRYLAFVSLARDLVAGAQNEFAQIYLHDAQTHSMLRVTQSAAGLPGNGDSGFPSLSADGRFLVFESEAFNLTPADANRAVADVFLYDRLTGTLELFSQAEGGAAANAASRHPKISGDGRFIAYASLASNLVAGTRPRTLNVFRQDRARSGPILLASRAASPALRPGDSDFPSISADGGVIAFHSSAVLLPTDFNSELDVFAFDAARNSVELISIDPDGFSGDYASSYPSISGDGRFVVFESDATTLDPGPVSAYSLVLLRDRSLGQTLTVSAGFNGAAPDDYCFGSVISPDGRFVAFVSAALNLAPREDGPFYDLWLWDYLTLTTTKLSHNSRGLAAVDDSYHPALSADARHIAFTAAAFNLYPGDGNAIEDVLRLERPSAAIDLMIRLPGEVYFDGSGVVDPRIVQRRSAESQFQQTLRYDIRVQNAGTISAQAVLMLQRSDPRWSARLLDPANANSNLGEAAMSGGWTSGLLTPGSFIDLILEATAPATAATLGPCTLRLDAFPAGFPGAQDRVRAVATPPFSPPGLMAISRGADGSLGGALSRTASLSRNGLVAVFQSDAATFVPFDLNLDTDVFAWNRASGRLELMSAAADGTPGDARSEFASLSDDGRFVAFASRASNLIVGDTNNREDIFVKDRTTRRVSRVSVSTAGQQASRGSESAKLSGDGRFVVYQSMAPNLWPGDTNGCWDVFLHDTVTRVTRCISLRSDGIPGNADSTEPGVSSDGRFVLFQSYASDLAPRDLNQEQDVFLYDTRDFTMTLISRATNGASANGTSTAVSMSADGRWVLFDSSATDLTSEPSASSYYLYDRTRQLVEPLVLPEIPGTDPQFFGVSLSPDGRFLALNSSKNNLAGSDTNGVSDVFILDLRSRALQSISVTPLAQSGDADSFGASFSSDGRFIALRSFASNLPGEDSAHVSQVYLFDRARFQPDLFADAGIGLPYRGQGAESAQPGIGHEFIAPSGPQAAIHLQLQNTSEFSDRFRLHFSPAPPPDWTLVLKTREGAAVLAGADAQGWLTPELGPGESVELRLEAAPTANNTRDLAQTLRVVSTVDAARVDAFHLLLRPDADGDWLPDGWEVEHFGSAALFGAADDPDQDGLDNLAEYRAGTLPANGGSVPRLTSIAPSASEPDSLRLEWPTAPGRVYTLEFAPTLASPFRPISAPAAGTGAALGFSHATALRTESGFYRLHITLY